jgi:hypothetical protein
MVSFVTWIGLPDGVTQDERSVMFRDDSSLLTLLTLLTVLTASTSISLMLLLILLTIVLC